MSKLPPLPEPTWVMPERMTGMWSTPGAYTAEQLQAYAAQVVEMCAKVCEDQPGDRIYRHVSQDCAKAIRALLQSTKEDSQ